jgi:hypothetical protein
LIKGSQTHQTNGPVRAALTADGVDCEERFDGDIVEYLRFRDGGGASTVITNNIGSVQSTGALSIGSTGVTQRVTVNDAAGLAEFARILLAGIDDLGMEGDLKEDVRAALEELEAEAEVETAPGKLKAALGRSAATSPRRASPWSRPCSWPWPSTWGSHQASDDGDERADALGSSACSHCRSHRRRMPFSTAIRWRS